MAKVTSKLQVTIPKAITEQYRIGPGDKIDWVPAGDVIRVITGTHLHTSRNLAASLRHFDKATRRQRRRQAKQLKTKPTLSRGWKREDLYTRGRPR